MSEDSNIRLYMFNYGPGRPMSLREFKGVKGEEGETTIEAPIPWYLLTHPRGNVIIDGGYGATRAKVRSAGRPHTFVLQGLKDAGFDPLDVRWVAVTHLHTDHSGAVAVMPEFPNAQVLTTRAEYEWAHTPDPFNTIAYAREDFVMPNMPWALLEDFEDGYDVFDDGVLRCWRTPGHTPGHLSFEIKLASGLAFIIVGDAAYTRDQLDGKAETIFTIDKIASGRSLERIKRLAWRNDALIVVNHDPDQWPTLKHAPEYYD